MSGLMILTTLLLPLGLIGFVPTRAGTWLVGAAALPALLLATFNPEPVSLSLDWLLLGIRLGLDETGRQFLAASALVWLLSGVYAADSLRDNANGSRFRVFFLLAMSGNFMLILAQDMSTFYLGFTLMGLSASGLVAHRTRGLARRAGRLYLSWTIVGEVALFSALVLQAAAAGDSEFAALRNTDPPTAAVALLVLGFGIKLALPGLHLWLPHSYAAAPAAGVAVLSGPMMGAGFLGLLRFLPPGSQVLVPWGELLIVIGLFGSLYGVVVGLLQDNRKVVLGYSSISKMGLLSAGFGIVLAHPDSTTLLLPALVFFTLHHLLVKSALFLGVDLLDRRGPQAWIRGGLILLGLALIGAPFTTGALAKTEIIAGLPDSFSAFSGWLSLAGLTTTLLMTRLAFLSWKPNSNRPAGSGLGLAAWALLTIVIMMLPWLITAPVASFSETLPLLTGLLLSGLVWRYRPEKLVRLVGRVPPGDILQPIGRALGTCWQLMAGPLQDLSRFHSPSVSPTQPRQTSDTGLGESSPAANQSRLWHWAGPLWLGLAVVLLLVTALGNRAA